jgi:hypothetical protein
MSNYRRAWVLGAGCRVAPTSSRSTGWSGTGGYHVDQLRIAFAQAW